MKKSSIAVSYDEALRAVRDAATGLGEERVALGEACGRVLAEDVRSDVDMPPFDKAAMDGYACRRADLANELTVVETVAAGCAPTKSIGPGECAKIMTGAVVPEGADCVIMVEHTTGPAGGKVRFERDDTEDNICVRGEDVRAGDTVLRKGIMIAPQHVALLAAAGCTEPLVAVRPRVGIISTGSELVDPSEKPAASQIRNSNGSQLAAQAARAGAVPCALGMAGDTEEAIEAAIRKAASENDLVVLTGGVSMGEYDLVPDILGTIGFETVFDKVDVKPGRPTLFCRMGDVCCFGLPGNPVSSFVIFELFVRPLVCEMMGHEWVAATSRATLGEAFSRKKTERLSWVPVTLDADGAAIPVDYHGPAHSRALCLADALMPVPIGVGEVAKGTEVTVTLL